MPAATAADQASSQIAGARSGTNPILSISGVPVDPNIPVLNSPAGIQLDPNGSPVTPKSDYQKWFGPNGLLLPVTGPTDGTGQVDPNSIVANNPKDDPNSDISKQDQITNDFNSFGYTPTDAEVAAFIPLAGGTNKADVTNARATIANYIIAVRNIQNDNANNPNIQILADERGFFNDTQARAAGLEKDAAGIYQQVSDIAAAPPKLFGGLTQDQVDQYLAPLKTQFDVNSATLQGDAARRGLAGSSTELDSLANANNTFKENVLQTGLNVGLQQQQQQEALLTGQANTLFAGGENAYGQLPSISGQIGQTGQNLAQQNAANSLLLGGLPASALTAGLALNKATEG